MNPTEVIGEAINIQADRIEKLKAKMEETEEKMKALEFSYKVMVDEYGAMLCLHTDLKDMLLDVSQEVFEGRLA